MGHVAGGRRRRTTTAPVGRDDLERTLALFVEMLRDILGQRLCSVLLYGSVVYDDLAPGYGDLDFPAVLDGTLTEGEGQGLVELRRPLRAGRHGTLAAMLEGAFLSRGMLNPARCGRALWWGTSGERVWERNRLDWLTLHAIREHGFVIWGDDVRREIPVVVQRALLDEVGRACRTMRQHGRGGSLHAVDWLLTGARLLLWLREGRLGSKSEAAEWGAKHCSGRWCSYLLRARQMRLEPTLADSAEGRAWLATLTGPIQEACAEVEQALAAFPTPVG